MRDLLIGATDRALRAVTQARFYRSERGFHGRFYCSLQAELDALQVINAHTILEMEYQKRAFVHGTRQRPDIILHVPVEHSGALPTQNNFCVWALKFQADAGATQEDFGKLDEMFEQLEYPLGIFVNVATQDHWTEQYSGPYGQRVLGVAVVRNDDGSVKTTWSGR